MSFQASRPHFRTAASALQQSLFPSTLAPRCLLDLVKCVLWFLALFQFSPLSVMPPALTTLKQTVTTPYIDSRAFFAFLTDSITRSRELVTKSCFYTFVDVDAGLNSCSVLFSLTQCAGSSGWRAWASRGTVALYLSFCCSLLKNVQC